MKRAVLSLAFAFVGCAAAPEPILVPPPPPGSATAIASSGMPPDPLAERPNPQSPAPFVPEVPVVLDGPGGAKIWLLERHTLPLVSVAVASSIGAAAEPRELTGLSVVTADMLDEGAGTRDALAFSAALEELGAHLASASDRDKSVVALDVLASKLDAALPLLADAILHPRHDAKDFARVADLWKNDLKARGDDPNEVARLVSTAVLFGLDHPYGRPLDGTLQSAARVKVGDVARWHRAVWRPDRMTFVVVGDVSKDAITTMLAKAFPSFTSPKETAPTMPATKAPPPPPRAVIVDRADAPQIVMTVIRDGVTAASEVYPRLEVLNVALGGSFTSRLNQNLREDHGWTYGARSQFVAQRASGVFLARASIRTDAIEPALKETLKEIDALAKEGMGNDETAKARSLLRAHAVERYGSLGAIAHGLASNAALGLPPDHDARELAAQGVVSKTDLLPLAQKYLALGSASIVLVGPRKAAEAALHAVGIDSPELRDAEGKPVGEKRPVAKAPKKRLPFPQGDGSGQRKRDPGAPPVRRNEIWSRGARAARLFALRGEP